MKGQPSTQPNLSLGECAYLAIEQHFKKTLSYEDDVIKDRDPESLHQMRVGMRRLRSAVTGFAAAIALPKAAQDSKIAKIARCLGILRDIDVLQDALENHYYPNLPADEQEILIEALVALANERDQALRAVQKILAHQRYKDLKKAFKKWLKTPKYQTIAQQPIQGVLPDLLLPEMSRFFLHPAWLVGVEFANGQLQPLPDLSAKKIEAKLADQGEILHSLRKETKRVRYQMSLFREFYGEDYAHSVQDMKSIQEILGQMQDSVVLAEFLNDRLDSDIETMMPTLAQQLIETRYQAWQAWQPLQQRYLSVETRYNLRAEILRPKETLVGDRTHPEQATENSMALKAEHSSESM